MEQGDTMVEDAERTFEFVAFFLCAIGAGVAVHYEWYGVATALGIIAIGISH